MIVLAPDEVIKAFYSLPTRERDIAILLSKGLSNREIGALLKINVNTVGDYCKRLFQRLDVTSRVEVAVIVTKLGLV